MWYHKCLFNTSVLTIDEELLDLAVLQLHVLPDLRERHHRLRLGQLHERQQLHLGQVVFVLEAEAVDKVAVGVVELLVGLQLVGHEDLQQIVDQLA